MKTYKKNHILQKETQIRNLKQEIADLYLESLMEEESSGKKELIRFATFLQWQDWKKAPDSVNLLTMEKSTAVEPIKKSKGTKLSFNE